MALQQERVDGRLEALMSEIAERLEQLARKPVIVHVHVPERSTGVGCSQAEVHRLVDLLYLESCSGHEQSEPCKRLLRLVNGLKEHSLDELRARLGI